MVFEGFIFLKPHLPSLFYYGTFFVFGYVFHTHRDILETFSNRLPQFAVLAGLLFPLSVVTVWHALTPHHTVLDHLTSVVVNALLTWALIYFFMGLFLRFLDLASPWVLYISNSSYWVYLLHMPVVAAMAWLLLPVPIHAVLKFLIVVLVATILCFSSYHYLVQRSWVSQLLNGMRFNSPWPWQPQRED